MEDIIEEIEQQLNTTAYIELNCADADVFSISVGGKCINVTMKKGNYGRGWLQYSIEDDS